MSKNAEEMAQILSTIEMFEVVTQSTPDDYQSLEILKEAYIKIGRETDAIEVSKRIAQAYVNLGQISSAILEYEGILQKQPDSVDVLMALGELEAKLDELTRRVTAPQSGDDMSASDQKEAEDFHNKLIETASTKKDKKEKVRLEGDPNEPFVKYLSKISSIPADKLLAAGNRAKTLIPSAPNQTGASLIEILAEDNVMSVEDMLCLLVDRTKLGYIPLDIYDVDRTIAKMIPQDVAMSRLIVPFDQISRTVMVALVNPFDEVGRQATQQAMEYNIHWFLASPEAVRKVLKTVYRLS